MCGHRREAVNCTYREGGAGGRTRQDHAQMEPDCQLQCNTITVRSLTAGCTWEFRELPPGGGGGMSHLRC
eukprot:1193892-Prorocentrum_minimum.AAC.5